MSLLRSIFNIFRFHRKNWKAVLLCILAATIFWFFNALNENYSANINFPLAIEYDEEQYVAVNPLPEQVRMNVSGLGWDLFRKSSGLKVPPLRVLLDNPTEVKKIPGSSLLTLLSPQLEGLQINLVLTDTLQIQIDHKASKTVQIQLGQVDAHLRKNYGLSALPRVQPTEIRIGGPLSLVNRVPDTLVLALPVSDLERNYSDELPIPMENDRVVCDPPAVQVMLSVDRMVKVTDTIPLHILNIPKEVKSAMLIKEVSFTYSIPSSLSQTVVTDSIRAELDLAGLKRGRHKFAPVIKGLPAFSQIERIDSVELSFMP